MFSISYPVRKELLLFFFLARIPCSAAQLSLYLSLQWLPVQYKSKSFQPEMDQTISVHLTGSCTVKTCCSHLAFKQICLGSNKDSSSETYHRCMLLSKLGLNRMRSITSFLALFRKVSSLPLIPIYSPQDTIYTLIVGFTVFPTQFMDINVTSKNHTELVCCSPNKVVLYFPCIVWKVSRCHKSGKLLQ